MDREYLKEQSRVSREISNRYTVGEGSDKAGLPTIFIGYKQFVAVTYPDNYINGKSVSNR